MKLDKTGDGGRPNYYQLKLSLLDIFQYDLFKSLQNPETNFLFKVKNRNTRKPCEISGA